MHKITFVAVLLFFAAACSQKSKKEEAAAGAAVIHTDTLSGSRKLAEATGETARDTGYHNFDSVPGDVLLLRGNMEMVPFCVLVPGKEYVADEKAGDIKGKLVFRHKTQKDNEVVVQGLMRSDTTVNLQEYFTNSYSGAEEEGKIIEKKELLPQKGCFYFWGCYNNLIYKSRFLEIVWLRPQETVTYSATFNIADTTVWKNRLRGILDQGSDCE